MASKRPKPSFKANAQANYTGRSGWDLDASLYNYAETKALMKNTDPELRKSMDKTIRGLLGPISKRAKSFVPDQPLSGWNYGDAGDRYSGKSRLPFWNPSLAKRGIAVRQGGKRSKGSVTQAAWKITNSSAAGAALETAGRGPSQHAFVKAIMQLHGKPSRLIWRAWDEAGGERNITDEVVQVIKEHESQLQTQLNAMR
jgi:hypothetical protein